MTGSEPLKILHVITKLDVGGAQTVVGELVREQISSGHTVAVATGSVWPNAMVSTVADVAVHRIKSMVHPLSPLQDFAAVRELAQLMKATRFDVVHAHSSKGGLLGRIAARLSSIPSVYTAHGWPFQVGPPKSQRIQSLVGEWLGARIGNEIVCVNTDELQLARQFRIGSAKHRHVIYNGVAFADAIDRTQRLVGDPFRLVMVARFERQKRADVVVEALSLLDDRVTLTLVGDGEFRSKIESLVDQRGLRSRVTFVGIADPFPYLRNADAFVLASDWEGMPVTVLEAMRAGLPVIANNLLGNREAVGPNTGLLTTLTAKGFASIVQSLANDPKRQMELGRLARSRWQSTFTAAAMASSYETLYRSVRRSR
jgi:glycosyltransferase involved in cell wall biosynthesis